VIFASRALSAAAMSALTRTETPAGKAMFASPAPAGRRITAGFTWLQRIGKSASFDVWFPDAVHGMVDKILAQGKTPGPENFPAEWAAVRQFELLQEAGNYKIYDLNPEHLMRTLRDITRNMKGGGYRVTVATIGSYAEAELRDELEILDRHLQRRISTFINMLYLEEQSGKINAALKEALRAERWDYQTALPHVGATLGARDLFRPQLAATATMMVKNEAGLIPDDPHRITVDHAEPWVADLGVKYAASEKSLDRVAANPMRGQYAVAAGVYIFAPGDAWKEVLISYRYGVNAERRSATKLSETDRKHRLARHFFGILGLLPQKHVLHDTAVGLQLPESINENQWIYIAPDGQKVGDFIRLMDDLFAPFNKLSLSEIHGRSDARSEIKGTVGHMGGYGDRLRPDADRFYRDLAHYTAQ